MAASLHLLYSIEYSDEGSNLRGAEEDTVFCFEAFLMACEGGGKAVIDVMGMLSPSHIETKSLLCTSR